MIKTLSKLIILVIVGLISFVGIQHYSNLNSNKSLPEQSQILSEEIQANSVVKKHDRSEGVFTLIFPDQNINLHNNVENITVEKFASDLGSEFLINAGYFLEDKSHAGLYISNGIKETNLAILDNQLSHVVQLDNNKIRFISKDTFNNQNVQNAFQTGPLFLENNIITDEYIDKSINGRGKYLRTIFGITKSGKSFFASFTRPYTLEEVANYLLNLPELQFETISAVNLDGGSSVAIYALRKDSFKFGSQKKLPFFLGWNKEL